MILVAIGVAALPLDATEKVLPLATVDAAVQVTPDPGASRAHTAPVVAVHPKDDRIVVVADATPCPASAASTSPPTPA